MNIAFWLTYGGSGHYVDHDGQGRPIGKGHHELAPIIVQNHVAYCGYAHRGYAPWTTA